MVIKGLRKRLNGDIDAQLASIDEAERRDFEALDKLRYRESVSWYHAPSGLWLEVEHRGPILESKLAFNQYTVIPTRYVPASVGSEKTGEHYTMETGFIADGLQHAVWTGGGRWQYGMCFIDTEKSKFVMRSQLITTITKLPEIFFELYKRKISIPMIQQAFKAAKDAAASGDGIKR